MQIANQSSRTNFSAHGEKVLIFTKLAESNGIQSIEVKDPISGVRSGKLIETDKKVSFLRLSPDSSKILAVSPVNNSVHIWDVESGRALGTPMQHAHAVNNARFSPDGTQVLTASFDGSARLWDSETGSPLGQAMTHSEDEYISDALFSPSGEFFVTRGSAAQLWEATTGTRFGPLLTHRDWLNETKFSPDSSRILTASSDGTAKLWRVPSTARAMRDCALTRLSKVVPPSQQKCGLFGMDCEKNITRSAAPYADSKSGKQTSCYKTLPDE